jgi:hypothetical protein
MRGCLPLREYQRWPPAAAFDDRRSCAQLSSRAQPPPLSTVRFRLRCQLMIIPRFLYSHWQPRDSFVKQFLLGVVRCVGPRRALAQGQGEISRL